MHSFHCPPFVPHPWMRNAHAQTILPAYWLRKRGSAMTVHHRIALDDGDTLILHDDYPPRWQAGERVALLVHGLGGSHASFYMPRMAAKLNAQGIRTFRLDLRGHGAGYYLAQQVGHAGRSTDAAAAARQIAELCPNSPLTAIGISMGGNIVLKMLGEAETLPGNIDSGLAVAPPIDIAACSQHMLLPQNRLYTKFFARELIRQVKRRRQFVESIRSLPLLPYPQTLWEFDDRFTAPLGGFSNVAEYYAQSSSAPLLANIPVPTLIIAAADDPIIPVAVFEDAEYSPCTRLVITEHGGHIGFVAHRRERDPDRHWIDWRIVDWTVGCTTAAQERVLST